MVLIYNEDKPKHIMLIYVAVILSGPFHILFLILIPKPIIPKLFYYDNDNSNDTNRSHIITYKWVQFSMINHEVTLKHF